MAVQVSYPGVYIEEFTPGAPIEGVGTSTAAFIGPTARGEINEPTKITSWDQFRATYGEQPLPGFYLWYAVRGFFENGGQVCYIVRVSNGSNGALTLNDRGVAPNQLIRVQVRQPGTTTIQIAVIAQHLLSTADSQLYKPTATLDAAISGREVVLRPGTTAGHQGGQFRPGDFITIGSAGESAQVVRVSGDRLLIDGGFTRPYADGDIVRLADATVGARVVRLQSSAPAARDALVPGAVLTIDPEANGDTQVVDRVQSENLPNGTTTYRITFRQGLRRARAQIIPLLARPSNRRNSTSPSAAGRTTISPLTRHIRAYLLDVVQRDANSPVRLTLVEPPPVTELPTSLPVALVATAIPSGTIENLSNLTIADYNNALDALRRIDDVNLVAAPDAIRLTDPLPLQQAIVTHCEQLGDRFAVLDARPNRSLFGTGSIELQRNGLDSSRGYAALYYPWLRVLPDGPGAPILVPPSGHMCGVIARTDATRGVHKAPANEIINGAFGVERTMSDIDQGQLNLLGINVVRVFQSGGRPILWGARTTSTDRNWQYVNIRRLFLYLEESIQEGIRWAIFEPNNLQLWEKLKRTITEFLTRVWRDGALFGETPEQAFYVRIDEVLNPFSEQALGRLHIEIGVRPSYPAEFIIVRIGIWPGGTEVAER